MVTKKQIKANKLINLEQKRQQDRISKIVREQIYPFLEKETKSIKEAKNILQILDSVIQSEAMRRISKQKVGEFELFTEKDSLEKKLFEFIKEEFVGDASAILRGLSSEIEFFLNKEQLFRDLKSLKIGKPVEKKK